MFEYQFMQHALIAIVLASLIGGIMGYLLLLRRLAFAAHGLGHISFTGATLALLLQFSPMLGQFISTILAGLFIAFFGEQLQKRDIAIAMVLSFMLGLGMLFLHFYIGSVNTATSLLFGDVLGVSSTELYWMLIMVIVILISLSIILRPLLFASIAPQLAEARGVPNRLIAMIFMMLLATAITLINQIMGALLAFVLLVGPAAISLSWTRSFWPGIILSLILALFSGILSLICSFYSNLPDSVCLTGIIFFLFLFSKSWQH